MSITLDSHFQKYKCVFEKVRNKTYILFYVLLIKGIKKYLKPIKL